jgi:hypothetical protein
MKAKIKALFVTLLMAKSQLVCSEITLSVNNILAAC